MPEFDPDAAPYRDDWKRVEADFEHHRSAEDEAKDVFRQRRDEVEEKDTKPERP
jgi:hypothetical protein